MWGEPWRLSPFFVLGCEASDGSMGVECSIFNCMNPWYHVNKDTGCSINFADEAIVDFDFLFAGAVVLFDGFVDDDFFNQGV